MIDGLAITIPLGEGVAGWLPLLPHRFALESAYRRALGYLDTDDGAVPTGKASEADFAAVLCAFVGLCWGDQDQALELVLHTGEGPRVLTVPPGPPALRKFDRDPVAFGDAVLDALVRRGFEVKDVYDAGRAVRDLVIESIPLQSEVEEAAGFTEATGADSTAPSSK